MTQHTTQPTPSAEPDDIGNRGQELYEHLQGMIEQGKKPVLRLGVEKEKVEKGTPFTIRADTREQALGIVEAALERTEGEAEDERRTRLEKVLRKSREKVESSFDAYAAHLSPEQIVHEHILKRVRSGKNGLRAEESVEVLELYQHILTEEGTALGITEEKLEAELYTVEIALRLTLQRNDFHTRYEEIVHAQERDSFCTSVYSKAAMPGKIESALEASETRSGSLIYFDLNGFKDINDRLGHKEGDRVLKAIADMLKETADSYEDSEGNSLLAARMGGDEFACFVPDDLRSEMLLDRIFTAFDDLTKELGMPKLHASIGVTNVTIPADATSETLRDAVKGSIERADELMLKHTKNDSAKEGHRFPAMIEGEPRPRSAIGQQLPPIQVAWRVFVGKLQRLVGIKKR